MLSIENRAPFLVKKIEAKGAEPRAWCDHEESKEKKEDQEEEKKEKRITRRRAEEDEEEQEEETHDKMRESAT